MPSATINHASTINKGLDLIRFEHLNPYPEKKCIISPKNMSINALLVATSLTCTYNYVSLKYYD